MSPLRRARFLIPAALVLLVIAGGCAKKRPAAPFDPQSGHEAAFFDRHPAVYRANGGNCLECHGIDLRGGIVKVSCSAASFDGRSCHPGGPGGGHPDGWSDPDSHGGGAKRAPGPGTGFDSCRQCHGTAFDGDSALSCYSCHGVPAPHPRRPWRGARSHTSTDPGNAAVCADCHRSNPGPAGCYNNTLCHGEAANHPAGWASASSHGRAAKSSPGSMSGFGVCKSCHGGNYAGGSAQSCFPCHGWKAPHAKTGWNGGGSAHRTTHRGNAGICADCHRSQPGPPGCFNATLCHGSGSGHPANWNLSSQHGPAAKASGGFASCRSCHGSQFKGGTSGQSCSPCHGWDAPHGRTGWDGGDSRHRTTSLGNVGVCASCHPVSAPSSGTTCSHNGGACHED